MLYEFEDNWIKSLTDLYLYVYRLFFKDLFSRFAISFRSAIRYVALMLFPPLSDKGPPVFNEKPTQSVRLSFRLFTDPTQLPLIVTLYCNGYLGEAIDID